MWLNLVRCLIYFFLNKIKNKKIMLKNIIVFIINLLVDFLEEGNFLKFCFSIFSVS